ncbi:MAG: hypothetical protein DCC67_09410 [Planctomycetota bacterium]|nr:MAG: hypothetical protein DCC67_09410 [Planctomycetota bacterium]
MAALSSLVVSSGRLHADPLPGRDLLKFTQAPMVNTTIVDATGVVNVYGGHDELSTAYGFADPTTGAIPIYQGKFMADDFADNLNSPIVHVKWWGSYYNDVINPNFPVNKFLISFEADVPQGPNTPFSHPGQPLLNQVVFRGPIAPGSGTFTEKLIRGPDPVVNESLYEYNAELHLGKEFPEKKDTVYWLKVVALVDVPPTIQFDPYNPPPAMTRWGWHNRDYTVQNPLASPAVVPGESVVGTLPGGTPIWHFQDDSVQGDVRITTGGAGGLVMPDVFQPLPNMVPQKYLDFADGPGSNVPGAVGIGSFSKDLAFELFTVPEPAALGLGLLSLAGVMLGRRRAS